VTSRRVGIVAFYTGLALLTGFVSFNGRKEPLRVAVAFHRAAWELFASRGTADEAHLRATFGSSARHLVRNDVELRADGNVLGYARRPLTLGLVALLHRSSGLAWDASFAWFRLATIVAAYLLFHWYLRSWFTTGQAIAGTLLVACSLPLTFVTNRWEILSDFPELIVFTLGLAAIRGRKAVPLGIVCFLGTLNRETTGLLVIIVALEVILPPRRIRGETVRLLGAGLAGCALATGGVQWWMAAGASLDVGVVGDRLVWLHHNLRGLSHLGADPHPYDEFLTPAWMFGVLWLMPWLAWSRSPRCLQAALLSVPVLVAIVFVLGALNEPRELIPLYPVLVPGTLIFMSELTTRDEPGGTLR
jgi:hypothetical protein